jgi:hypothetical protein
MTDRKQYAPGPASGAQARKDGEKWTLILVRPAIECRVRKAVRR